MFDPHSSPASAAAAGRGGVTRLVLSAAAPVPGNGSRRLQSSDFAPLAVSGLKTLITFSLPPPAGGGGNGSVARCSFYDEAVGTYSSAGCVSMPSPLPAGLTAEWVPAFVAQPGHLAAAWRLDAGSWATSPLLAGCTQAWLDCSNASQVTRSLYPDPYNPMSAPAISCGGSLRPQLLRVFYGARCGLWRPDNGAGCFWNATAQAFSGDGCVASGRTQCGCTHLTDFAPESAPTISVCSASDLLNLSPADIVTKLRLFLILISAMFGGAPPTPAAPAPPPFHTHTQPAAQATHNPPPRRRHAPGRVHWLAPRQG